MRSRLHDIDDRTGLEALDHDTCWSLLRAGTVGRLAVTVGRQPDIFPVNYAVIEGSLFIRTAPGTKLAAAVLGGPVAFEVDDVDLERAIGWSVVLHGRAEEVERLEDLLDLEEHGPQPWVDAAKNRWIRILPTDVTGRRIPLH